MSKIVLGARAGRLMFVDNLRWVMIVLVVSMHAAVTYSHLGSWYYMEDRSVSMAEGAAFGTYQGFLQSFFMGFLFFIAGYFVPGAYDSKGAGKFIRDRLYRLGLPLLFFVLLIQPFSVYCISLFHGEKMGSLGDVYGRYFLHGRWMSGTGPLWFCEALLLFCVGYVVYRKIVGSREFGDRTAQGPNEVAMKDTNEVAVKDKGVARSRESFGFPRRLVIAGFILLIAVLTWLVRIPWPNGTSFYNLQFCYFPQYVFFFMAGCRAMRGDWLTKLPVAEGRFWGRAGLIGGLVLWVTILALGGAFKGQIDAYKGLGTWQSFAMALWEQVAGVGISLFLLVWFRQRFNRQGTIAAFFSVNAFAVYVFHTPVLITISRMMSGLSWPLAAMFLAATVFATAVSYLLAAVMFRKLPLLKNIL